MDDEPTLSVTEFNTTIRDALRAAIPENVWVRGEVQGLRKSRPGHVYFQLVEKDERRNRVQAALDVALFRSHLMTVDAALRKVPGIELVDAVVVVRGGGSRADLAPFDTDDVARAIATMPLPVLTGIGHEVDRSVADEVAHTASKTPTACAQVLIEHVMEFVHRLDDVSRGVVHHARSSCALALRELRDCARRSRRGPPAALARELAVVERHRGRAEELGTRAVKQSVATLDGRERALASAGGRLARAEDRRLDTSEARLRALDPARVLERGYTITRDRDGRVVKRAAALSTGDRLVTEFADGTAAVVHEVDTRES